MVPRGRSIADDEHAKDGTRDRRLVSGRHDVYDQLARGLFRTGRRHLLVTGDIGVGKTATVRELARRAAAGQIPFLNDKRFLWIDAANVGPEDSRACLETLTAAVCEQPDVVLCIDGLEALLIG